MSASALEWGGSISGMAGAGLLALNLPISGYAYVPFLVSSAALLIFSLRHRFNGLALQQLTYLAINVVGLVRWVLLPSTGAGA